MISAPTTSQKIAPLFAAGLFYVGAIWAADHIQIRNIMIESQLAQVTTTAVLITGDSIVAWLAGPIGACNVINAGLGGGGVGDVKNLLSNLKEKSMSPKLSGIIVAIGVNDSRRRDFPVSYVASWKKDYEEMIDIALQLNSSVSVSTILPVEDGMPLGAKYFDQSLIESLNATIRQVAKQKNVRLIDTNKIFRDTVKNTSPSMEFI